MSELENQIRTEVKRIIDEPMPEPSPIKPPEIETENIFDPELEKPDPNFLEEMNEFLDDPMKPIVKMLGQYLESIKPPMALGPIKSEHKVKIFWLHRSLKLEEVEQIETMIEDLLNDGYCSHPPVVCNDFLIMDFSRRKETEENEREQQ